MSAELRSLIRELLQEELAALKGGAAGASAARREEVVTLATDADLAAFVGRLIRLAQDGHARAAIESGQHVFRLAGGGVPVQAFAPSAPAPNAPPPPTRFERGLVTEKAVANLPDGQRAISVGKHVRFTPLARDELRRRNIRIERTRT
jgi:hypothetical protein